MKTPAIITAVLALACIVYPVHAQSTAFTYQGSLSDENGPANGSFDMHFQLFPTFTGGSAVASLFAGVLVTNGLFSVTLDFGPDVFDGTDYWVEIGVHPHGAEGFTTLSPRQPLNLVPYAIHAKTAMDVLNPMFLGTTTDAPLEFFVNNTRGLRLERSFEPGYHAYGSVNLIGGMWSNFVGDGVEGVTISGGGFGSKEANDAPQSVLSSYGSIGGGLGNIIRSNSVSSTISGGNRNAIGTDAANATIGGGSRNIIEGGFGHYSFSELSSATIAGGSGNRILRNGIWATIGGGVGNSILGGIPSWSGEDPLSAATIGGGVENTVYPNAVFPTIGGGYQNRIHDYAHSAVIGGGLNNVILTNAFQATVSGGSHNVIEDGAELGTIGGGNGNAIEIRASGGTIGGGRENRIHSIFDEFEPNGRTEDATIGGGFRNSVGELASHATISGGNQNTIGADAVNATIGGGVSNDNQGENATISGGVGNIVTKASFEATIGGGTGNVVDTRGNPDSSGSATIGGGRNNLIQFVSVGSTIGGGSGNRIQERAAGATIGGGSDNTIGTNATSATISGGRVNRIEVGADHAAIGGGQGNRITAQAGDSWSFIGGGFENYVTQTVIGTIGGGWCNSIFRGNGATIGGGQDNFLTGLNTTIGGGGQNGIHTNAQSATISGGSGNIIQTNASFATIPGGSKNTAGGQFSFAAGRNAEALHDGSFVWADASAQTTPPSFYAVGIAFPSSTTNEFAVRATGGVRFVTGIDTNGTPTAGVQVPAGGTGWSAVSDRNMKENFEPVDGKAVLEQIAAMPIKRWNMKSQPDSIRHIGPMAQDFYAAFGVGEDNRHINTVDADGVALAAIQGLNRKLEEELQAKEERIAALEATVAELKALVLQTHVQ